MDIQINEERLLKWKQECREKIGPKPSWIDNLYHKTNKAISNYFHPIRWNFREWKELMMVDNNTIKVHTESRSEFFKETKIYFPTGFVSHYLAQKDYVRFKTPWEIYERLSENPTITEFVKYMNTWKGGIQRGYKKGNMFNFKEMFLDV